MHSGYFLFSVLLLPKRIQVHGVLCFLCLSYCALAGQCSGVLDCKEQWGIMWVWNWVSRKCIVCSIDILCISLDNYVNYPLFFIEIRSLRVKSCMVSDVGFWWSLLKSLNHAYRSDSRNAESHRNGTSHPEQISQKNIPHCKNMASFHICFINCNGILLRGCPVWTFGWKILRKCRVFQKSVWTLWDYWNSKPRSYLDIFKIRRRRSKIKDNKKSRLSVSETSSKLAYWPSRKIMILFIFLCSYIFLFKEILKMVDKK